MNTKVGIFIVWMVIFQTFAQSAFAITLEIYRDSSGMVKSDQTP